MEEMRTRAAKRRVGALSATLLDDTIVHVARAAELEAATHAAQMQHVWHRYAEPLFVVMSHVCKAWHHALEEFGFEALWRAAFTLRFPHLLEHWEPHLPDDVSYRSLYNAAVSAHGLLYIKDLGGLSQAPIEYVVLKYGVLPSYLQNQHQSNAAMRAILIDWLVTVVRGLTLCGLDFHVVYRAVGLLDRYLSTRMVKQSKLQLLGLACARIAAKHEALRLGVPSIEVPSPKVLVHMTGNTFTEEQVVRMEGKVLRRLHFELPVPTALDVLDHFLFAYAQLPWLTLEAPYNEALCRYIFDLTLREYVFFEFGAEVCAVAALQLVLHTAGKPWPSALQRELSSRIGFTPSQLQRCVFALHTVWRASASNPLQAIQQAHFPVTLIRPPESPYINCEGMEEVPAIAIPLRLDDPHVHRPGKAGISH